MVHQLHQEEDEDEDEEKAETHVPEDFVQVLDGDLLPLMRNQLSHLYLHGQFLLPEALQLTQEVEDHPSRHVLFHLGLAHELQLSVQLCEVGTLRFVEVGDQFVVLQKKRGVEVLFALVAKGVVLAEGEEELGRDLNVELLENLLILLPVHHDVGLIVEGKFIKVFGLGRFLFGLFSSLQQQVSVHEFRLFLLEKSQGEENNYDSLQVGSHRV